MLPLFTAQVHANKCLLAASSSNMRSMALPSLLPAVDAALVTVISDSSQEEQNALACQTRRASEEDILVSQRNPRSEVIVVNDSVSPPGHKRAAPVHSSKIDHFFMKRSNKNA
jgi:hypothetical protein